MLYIEAHRYVTELGGGVCEYACGCQISVATLQKCTVTPRARQCSMRSVRPLRIMVPHTVTHYVRESLEPPTLREWPCPGQSAEYVSPRSTHAFTRQRARKPGAPLTANLRIKYVPDLLER